MMDFSGFENSRLDSLPSLYKFHTNADVLRLDLMHPVISGNKWFKLKEYFKEAINLRKTNIITYGGAYSNHLVATAAFAQASRLKSTGLVRGERPAQLSPTILQAEQFGMKIIFLSREDYKRKIVPPSLAEHYTNDENYLINEGGYGMAGAQGAKAIMEEVDTSAYTHIVAAVGTGTTLAGLISAAANKQHIIGISVLKNNLSVEKEIKDLLPNEKINFTLLYDFHFGGYAKYTPELISFMNDWYTETGIPSDFVYTGKLFYAAKELIVNNFFPKQSKLLIIHSGGLQGNRSLPPGKLIFQ